MKEPIEDLNDREEFSIYPNQIKKDMNEFSDLANKDNDQLENYSNINENLVMQYFPLVFTEIYTLELERFGINDELCF